MAIPFTTVHSLLAPVIGLIQRTITTTPMPPTKSKPQVVSILARFYTRICCIMSLFIIYSPATSDDPRYPEALWLQNRKVW